MLNIQYLSLLLFIHYGGIIDSSLSPYQTVSSNNSSLPELLEKKRLIDLHTNVATAVLDHIKVSV